MANEDKSVVDDLMAAVNAKAPELLRERDELMAQMEVIRFKMRRVEHLLEMASLARSMGAAPTPVREVPPPRPQVATEPLSTPQQVLVVLRESKTPMTPGEIIAKMREKFGDANGEQAYSAIGKLYRRRKLIDRSMREGTNQQQYWALATGKGKGGAT